MAYIGEYLYSEIAYIGEYLYIIKGKIHKLEETLKLFWFQWRTFV